jgi:flagellar biosynthesis protein FlhG
MNPGPDQASRLREMMSGKSNRARIISIASGKGGVGKSNFAINFSIALVAAGKRVLLLDADLGLANVDILCGLRCPYNIGHVIAGVKTLKDVIVQSPGGVNIIPGASGLHDVVNMSEDSKKQLIRQLSKIEDYFDYIIIDTQAGVSSNVMNFISPADETLVVTTPEPTALADAYALIKMVAGAKAHSKMSVVVNMVDSVDEGNRIADKLRGVTQRFLNFELGHRGNLLRDSEVTRAVRQRHPFALLSPNCPANKNVTSIAQHYLNLAKPRVKKEAQGSVRGFFSHLLRKTGAK